MAQEPQFRLRGSQDNRTISTHRTKQEREQDELVAASKTRPTVYVSTTYYVIKAQFTPPEVTSRVSLITGAIEDQKPYSLLKHSLSDADVLLLAREKDYELALTLKTTYIWKHAVFVFEDKGLKVFDFEAATGMARIRDAHTLIDDGWLVAGICPWHTRPEQDYVDRLRLHAYDMVRLNESRFSGPIAEVEATKELLRTLRYNESTPVLSHGMNRIHAPLDIATDSAFLEYPNIVALLHREQHLLTTQ